MPNPSAHILCGEERFASIAKYLFFNSHCLTKSNTQKNFSAWFILSHTPSVLNIQHFHFDFWIYA